MIHVENDVVQPYIISETFTQKTRGTLSTTTYVAVVGDGSDVCAAARNVRHLHAEKGLDDTRHFHVIVISMTQTPLRSAPTRHEDTTIASERHVRSSTRHLPTQQSPQGSSHIGMGVQAVFRCGYAAHLLHRHAAKPGKVVRHPRWIAAHVVREPLGLRRLPCMHLARGGHHQQLRAIDVQCVCGKLRVSLQEYRALNAHPPHSKSDVSIFSPTPRAKSTSTGATCTDTVVAARTRKGEFTRFCSGRTQAREPTNIGMKVDQRVLANRQSENLDERGALGGVKVEGAEDELTYLDAVRVRNRREGAAHDLEHKGGEVGGVKRLAQAGHFVQHTPQRPYVALLVVRLPFTQLWRDVTRGSNDRVCFALTAQNFGNPEIADFHYLLRSVKHNVLRLEIPMQDVV
eukprot:m.1430635 g.1430635  ORF g.1430635 m.1430635 type:complete len:402 (-) comp25074_c0_seq12:990-2195(-)